MPMLTKIVHVMPALFQGGAETQLERLAYHASHLNIECVVITLKSDKTPLTQRLLDNGITVHCMGFNGLGCISGFIRLIKTLKRLTTSTTVIQCWMYHANFFGLLAAWASGVSDKVIWNIRCTQIPKRVTGIISKLSAKLSFLFPVNIICCADAAKASHIQAGYNPIRFKVIYNGIDTDIFRPSVNNRYDFRQEIAVSNNDFVIGMVGRYAPIKGHIYLLQAFDKLLKKYNNFSDIVKLVLVGRGVAEASDLQPFLSDLVATGNVIVLPERADIGKIMCGFDLLCLPSISEGFPNVVAEAMACGIPALVTDVGDAAFIVNDHNYVLPAQNTTLLTDKLASCITLQHGNYDTTYKRISERITTNFSVAIAWEKYLNVYNKIIK